MKLLRPRGKSRELSYACWQYSHKRCKGVTCKCDCHEKKRSVRSVEKP